MYLKIPLENCSGEKLMNGNIDFILYLKVCMPFSLCNIELFQLYRGSL